MVKQNRLVAAAFAARHQRQPKGRFDRLAILHHDAGFAPDTGDAAPEIAPPTGRHSWPTGEMKKRVPATTAQANIDERIIRFFGSKDVERDVDIQLADEIGIHTARVPRRRRLGVPARFRGLLGLGVSGRGPQRGGASVEAECRDLGRDLGRT